METTEIKVSLIDTIQDLTFRNKGLAIISKLFNQNREGLQPEELDSAEYFLTSIQKEYAEQLKSCTDQLL